MIFASDPQLLWLSAGLTDEHLGANPLWCDGDCYDRRAKETNRRQLLGMNTIQFASSFADGTRGFWPKSADAGKSAGRQIKRPQDVVAIFAGHFHETWGRHGSVSVDGSDAFLVIWVEGVDLGERDKVSFNGEDIGYLAQQTFYNEVYEVKAGPGIYGLDRTDLVPSFFTIPSDKLESTNTVSIEMDDSGGGWIAEVETSELLVQSPALIPEPGTWAQLAAGLGALALMLGRPRKQ